MASSTICHALAAIALPAQADMSARPREPSQHASMSIHPQPPMHKAITNQPCSNMPANTTTTFDEKMPPFSPMSMTGPKEASTRLYTSKPSNHQSTLTKAVTHSHLTLTKS